MSLERYLLKRSNELCELCGSAEANIDYAVPKSAGNKLEHHIWICTTCNEQLNDVSKADGNHWRCLNETIWSEEAAVKVVSWRMLHKLRAAQPALDWISDLLDIAYLDDDTLAWAKAAGDGANPEDIITHIDCFGTVLQKGDNVVLTKTLNVKGATFNAPVGTIVRNIHLVADNADQIEGKINGALIVILTKYVKKSAN